MPNSPPVTRLNSQQCASYGECLSINQKSLFFFQNFMVTTSTCILKGGSEESVQSKSFNHPDQLNKPTCYKIDSTGKSQHFFYLFLLPRTLTTFKWNLRPAVLCGRKTQYNQAKEVIKISCKNSAYKRLTAGSRWVIVFFPKLSLF